MGGWNKGIKNSTGIHTGHKHSPETIAKIKNRPSDSYKKPMASQVITDELCHYGCSGVALYQFANKKLCCSAHQNSCPGKRKQFSDRTDHKERNAKSLSTRIETGITKSSQIKAAKTRRDSGHYERLADIMKVHWSTTPWQNNLHCPLIAYNGTTLLYQGTYELAFLKKLQDKHGLPWVTTNVTRGPSVWYDDPTGKERLYISDFIIGNTIYEIKSGWTWNHKGTDHLLEEMNKAKLTRCVELGYNVVLVLEGNEINYVN